MGGSSMAGINIKVDAEHHNLDADGKDEFAHGSTAIPKYPRHGNCPILYPAAPRPCCKRCRLNEVSVFASTSRGVVRIERGDLVHKNAHARIPHDQLDVVVIIQADVRARRRRERGALARVHAAGCETQITARVQTQFVKQYVSVELQLPGALRPRDELHVELGHEIFVNSHVIVLHAAADGGFSAVATLAMMRYSP